MITKGIAHDLALRTEECFVFVWSKKVMFPSGCQAGDLGVYQRLLPEAFFYNPLRQGGLSGLLTGKKGLRAIPG